MIIKPKFAQPIPDNCEAGFTLLETAISGLILMVGLIAMLGVFTLAISTTQGVQLDQIAKQKAMETLESIYAARSTQQITFGQIANTGSGGVFVGGTVNGILTPGPDGLDGTADDGTTPQGACPLPFQCVILPGPDGILGGANSADDITLQLSNFNRTITIVNTLDAFGNVNPDLKQVTVTVGYTDARNHPRNYSVQALLSAYR